MPTEEEYTSKFTAISDGILSGPYKTRADVRRLVAQANNAVRAERERCNGEIWVRWKEQFGKIKKEEDECLKALDIAYHGEAQRIMDRAGDMEEGTGE